jgi:hypothetical protein
MPERLPGQELTLVKVERVVRVRSSYRVAGDGGPASMLANPLLFVMLAASALFWFGVVGLAIALFR